MVDCIKSVVSALAFIAFAVIAAGLVGATIQWLAATGALTIIAFVFLLIVGVVVLKRLGDFVRAEWEDL